ncbi:MAG: alanine--tRNA ligase [Clostridia bacterium]|nr:alanine--tRNA ligase [Clostridia bacterium]
MEWTGLNELREKYLSFFESKGHLRFPSASLIPQGDKSLLLINAGMAPLKKYFTGELTPPCVRVTSCQKCIRTPDIERVGKTARHGTYFEMLGNFSFGDYFKREATAWAWEFCTKVMQMDPEKLFISVYLDDDEAYDIWTKEIGVAEDHMVRLGKEDNFWEHGAGPCGPCSEIYYDRGEKYGCGKPDCKVGCDCDRYVEFWNLVFTQFENDGNNNYTRLKNCNIDTGMGLERLACIAQNVDNLFEVDTVQNIMKHIMQIAGVKYHENEKSDVSLRVITDHIRSTTFMIGDGVMPSNEGRGYVLRRLLRRAARHGRLLGIDRPFLSEVCATVIHENETAYPNLVEKQEFITNVIRNEEENFSRTIDAGLQLLSQMIESADGDTLSGKDAFMLSDTFGFPIDLTKEILEEKGMTVDEAAFDALVAEQRARSRAARKDAGAEAWKNAGVVTKGLPKTEYAGETAFAADGEVLTIIAGGERVEYAENGAEVTLVLDRTAFYAESGGQVGDVGAITAGDTVFTVTNCTKTNDGVFLHTGSVTQGDGIAAGAAVRTAVDSERKHAIMRNHTAAHLLQAALRRVLGTHVEQAGQYVNEKAVRFDFTHFSAMTADELREVERLVNAEILKAEPVTKTEMPIDEAKKIGAMALFGEKYGDVVRVVCTGSVTDDEKFSIELCGGSHVDNTSALGLFKIVSESSVAAGVRRIEGVTGMGVLDYLNDNLARIQRTAAAMKLGNVSELEHRASSLMGELRQKDKEIDKLSAELSAIKAGSVFGEAKAVGCVRLFTAVLDGTVTADELRGMCNSAKDKGDDVVVLVGGVNEKGAVSLAAGCGKTAVAAGAHAGTLVREAAKIAGGAGGGKPDSAMAGAKDPAKLADAVAAAADILAGMLK